MERKYGIGKEDPDCLLKENCEVADDRNFIDGSLLTGHWQGVMRIGYEMQVGGVGFNVLASHRVAANTGSTLPEQANRHGTWFASADLNKIYYGKGESSPWDPPITKVIVF